MHSRPQVFHCVICPRLEFDLPILSIDLVVANERVTLAIVDPCPLSPSLKLPPIYEGAVRWAAGRQGGAPGRREASGCTEFRAVPPPRLTAPGAAQNCNAACAPRLLVPTPH